MGEKSELMDKWVYEALTACGGEASIVQIAKHIWENHETELRSSEELFFTWQYRMRWAGQNLVKARKIKKDKVGSRAKWIKLR